MPARAIHKVLKELAIASGEQTDSSIEIAYLASLVDLPIHMVIEYLETLKDLGYVTLGKSRVILTETGRLADNQ